MNLFILKLIGLAGLLPRFIWDLIKLLGSVIALFFRYVFDFLFRVLDLFVPLTSIALWIRKVVPGVWRSVTEMGPVKRLISRNIFRKFGDMTQPRPHSHSMAADYPTWYGFVDRKFTGRHLKRG